MAPSIDNAVPSERFDGEFNPKWKNNCSGSVTFDVLVRLPSASGSEGNAAPWTTEEQKLLEQALKTYTVSTPERWEKIAATVPGRSKKDCMKRYKVGSQATHGNVFC